MKLLVLSSPGKKKTNKISYHYYRECFHLPQFKAPTEERGPKANASSPPGSPLFSSSNDDLNTEAVFSTTKKQRH